MSERTIYFNRNDKDTWAMARLHHSLLKEIEDNPLWEREEIPDIPLTEEQEKKRRQQMAGYPHRTILGVANRWEERKGLETFIRLAEELPANYTVEILGLDKAQTVQLKKKFPTGKLLPIDRTANVQLLSSIYRSADVYVNATMEDNFPTTNLEALACGTPVITYDTGGSGESVTEDCGIVVEKGNYEKLLAAILKVCEEHPFSAKVCRQRAQNYDRSDRYAEYLALYERILHEHEGK